VIHSTSVSTGAKDAVVALHAAESGVERALVDLKNGSISSYPYTFNGTINGATYQVVVEETPDGYRVTSTGTKGIAQRTVEVEVESGGVNFYPFAVNGQLNIDDVSSVGKGSEWDDALMAVKSITPSETKTELEKVGFEIFIKNQLDLPKVEDLNEEDFFPDEDECDYGSYETATYIDVLNLRDLNNDGRIVICGESVTLDRSLIKFPEDLIIASQGDIVFERGTTLKQRVGSASNLALVAEGQLIFDDNSNIDFSGADEGYNILLYAKEGITRDDPTGQWISISGNQNTENTSNLFVLTPGEINVASDLVDETATTKNDVNMLFWADKGIYSNGRGTNGGLDVSGSSRGVRNFSVIVADGDADFSRWQFTGQEHRSGLTYEDIVHYCEDDPTIPPMYRSVFCQLKEMIEKGSTGSKVTVKSWKVD